MKKIGAFLVGVGLIAGVTCAADSNTATSVNIVGFNKITCPSGKYVLVNTAFESLSGSTLTASDVFSNQLPMSSSVWAFDAGASTPAYVRDVYTEEGWTTPAKVIFRGGMGFWIYVPAEAVPTNYIVTLAGQVPMSGTASNAVYSGFNLLGNPYTGSVLWTNTALAARAAMSDKVYTFNVVSNVYDSNVLTEEGWFNPNLVITADMGFWFVSSVGLFTNVETRPYNP